MQRNIRLALTLLVAFVALLSGCHKKQPQIVPPQAQAPTTNTPAPVQPQPAPAAPQTPTVTAPATSTTPQQPTETAPKPKPKHTTHPAKRAPAEQEKAANKKVVPAEGGADNTVADISVGMNRTEAAHEREITEKLLQSTEANLSGLNRPLSSDEAAMAEEVRNYMAQARQAMNDGDLIRANNLAVKAHLLSDALVKH